MNFFKITLYVLAFIPVHVITICITVVGSPFLVGIFVTKDEITKEDVVHFENFGNYYTFKYTLLLFYGIYGPIWFPIVFFLMQDNPEICQQCENNAAIITVLETENRELQRQAQVLRDDFNLMSNRREFYKEKILNLKRGYDELVTLNHNQTEVASSNVAIDIEDQPALNCSICFNDMLDEECHQIVFTPCGHTCCNNCAPRLTECHQCRIEIENKIRVFDA